MQKSSRTDFLNKIFASLRRLQDELHIAATHLLE